VEVRLLPPIRMSAEDRCRVHAGLIPDDVMTRVVTSKLDTLRSKVGRNELDGEPATHGECRIGS
jgi:hypothetical protein